jgi:hypothetical protein
MATRGSTRRVGQGEPNELQEFYASRPSLVDWRAVLSGTVIALGVLGFLTALWAALAWGSEVGFIKDNFEWFIAGSAVVSVFFGGYLSGYNADLRGTGPGMWNGLTMWGLLFVVSASIGIPSVLNVLNVQVAPFGGTSGFSGPRGDNALWATAIAILVGALAAAAGGAIGGRNERPDGFFAPSDVDRRRNDGDVRTTRRAG